MNAVWRWLFGVWVAIMVLGFLVAAITVSSRWWLSVFDTLAHARR